ncbi:MAG: hypothetical protein CMQ75_03315 [Gammaproteobacteria bacterium]|nr:hypothetical protein [Gammaproteobacteria bacterium]|tara:strand:+ start:2614 stop:4089 length:1476 start_codon:yes stop_codon:yes gene_type:complete
MPIKSDNLVPLGNKQLRVYDKSGLFTRLSPDELIANKINYWKNWYCSAGERSLYIDYNGCVWISNCSSSNYFKEKGEHHNRLGRRYGLIGDEYKAGLVRHIKDCFGPWPHRDWFTKHDLHMANEQDYEQKKKAIKIFEIERSKVETEYLQKFLLDRGLCSKEEIDNNNFLKLRDWVQVDRKNFSFKKPNPDNFGYCGDIYNEIKLPRYWVKCPYEYCGCGADINISKAKESKFVNDPPFKFLHLAVSREAEKGQFRTRNNYSPDIQEPVAIELNFPVPFQILWDIGKRCNYNCNYCWPDVHSPTASHHDFVAIKKTITYIIKNWSKEKEIRWSFGGGEPTLHPNFLDIVKFLKEKNQWVMLTTNGSRDNNYWKELRKYCNSVLFSAHFESMAKFNRHEDRFIKNVNLVLDWHNNNDDDHWVEIKLMTPPGWLDYALKFKEKLNIKELEKPGKNGRMKGCCSLVPIRLSSWTREEEGLADYSPSELEFFKNQ